MYKLEALAVKLGQRETATESERKLKFMIDYVADRWISESVEKGEFSTRNLSGKGLPGNRGALDLALYKLTAVRHLTHTVLESLPGSATDKSTIRDAFESFDSFRAQFGYPNDSTPKPARWTKLLGEGMQLFVALAAKTVYGLDHDGHLKQCLRNGKSFEECLEEGVLGEEYQTMKDVVEDKVADVLKEAEEQQAGSQCGSKRDFQIAMNVSDAQKAAEPQLLMKVNSMSECQKELLMNHELEAQRMTASSFELLVEKTTAKQIAEDLRNSEFGKVKGTGGEEGRYCFISYQSKLAGESTSLPHLRPPSLRNAASLPGGAHLKKMVQAVLQSRSPGGTDISEIHAGDCFVLGDAGKHGNNAALLTPFVDSNGATLVRSTKTLHANYDEEDIRARIPHFLIIKWNLSRPTINSLPPHTGCISCTFFRAGWAPCTPPPLGPLGWSTALAGGGGSGEQWHRQFLHEVYQQ